MHDLQVLRFASYQVSSKFFVIGEYAVLHQEPAILATGRPCFSLRPGEVSVVLESPAGQLLRQFRERGQARPDLETSALAWGDEADPGGLGGSTAHFLLVWASIAQPQLPLLMNPRGWDLWERYRQLSLPASVPSGADLVAQIQGGWVWVNPLMKQVDELEPPRESAMFLSAAHQLGRKVRTHEHLAAVSPQVLPRTLLRELGKLVANARDRWREAPIVGQILSEYGDRLAQAGLEHPLTTADRIAFRSEFGVYGVKGVGAYQADGLVLWIAPSARSVLEDLAKRRNLRVLELPIGEGLRR